MKKSKMPIYEYRCTICNHIFEVVHEVGGTPGPCPVCGGAAKRIFTSVGLVFKGSGFHSTDYRKPASTDGKDAPATQKTSPKGGTSTEATPKGT